MCSCLGGCQPRSPSRWQRTHTARGDGACGLEPSEEREHHSERGEHRRHRADERHVVRAHVLLEIGTKLRRPSVHTLVDQFEPHVELVEPLVDRIEAPPDLFESSIHFLETQVDLIESGIHLFEANVDASFEVQQVVTSGDIGPADRRKVLHERVRLLSSEDLIEAFVQAVSGFLGDGH